MTSTRRSLKTWEPFRGLWDMEGDLGGFFFGMPWRRTWKEDEEGLAMWTPTMDIYEDKESVKVYADLPGMKKKDVAISVEGDILTVKGERKFEEEEKKKNYHRIERAYGTFRRSFTLPANVDAEKIRANMKDGTLTVTVPKKPEARPKEIEIEVS